MREGMLKVICGCYVYFRTDTGGCFIYGHPCGQSAAQNTQNIQKSVEKAQKLVHGIFFTTGHHLIAK